MAKQEKLHYGMAQTQLGLVLCAVSSKGLCAILIGDEPDVLLVELVQRFPKAQLEAGNEAAMKVVKQVAVRVENPHAPLECPLDIRGTPFQQKVWQALLTVPVGQTASYSDIARAIDAPRAMRAVAGACAANDLAIIIPCHRIVRNDGTLSGYGWGVERKRALLAMESHCQK